MKKSLRCVALALVCVLMLCVCASLASCKNVPEQVKEKVEQVKKQSTIDEAVKNIDYKTPEEIANAYMDACYRKFDAKKVMAVLDRRVLDKQFEMINTNYDNELSLLQQALTGQKKELEKAKSRVDWKVKETQQVKDDAFKTLKKYYKETYELPLDSVTMVKVATTRDGKTKDIKVFVMDVAGKLSIDRNVATYS